jgi:hypothetical protein
LENIFKEKGEKQKEIILLEKLASSNVISIFDEFFNFSGLNTFDVTNQDKLGDNISV